MSIVLSGSVQAFSGTFLGNCGLSMYGDGSDGNVSHGEGTFVSLTRDIYANNFYLSGSTILNLAGFRIFVRNTFQITSGSIINMTGSNGTSNSTIANGVAGNPPTINANKTVANGGAGGVGTSNGAIDNSANLNTSKPGGSGGMASDNPGGTGGTSTTAGLLHYNSPFRNIGLLFYTNNIASRTPSVEWVAGGGGGGGGSPGLGSYGSGGGGAGGTVIISAKNMIISGSNDHVILAYGGNGGAGAYNGVEFSGNGGGGAGGTIILNYQTKIINGTGMTSGSKAHAGSAGNLGGGGGTVGSYGVQIDLVQEYN